MIPERTPLFLMANLGSEVERLLRADEEHQDLRVLRCVERALRIVDQLTESPEMRPRLSEILTLKNVIDDFRNKVREYAVEPDDLRNYFTPFALRLLHQR